MKNYQKGLIGVIVAVIISLIIIGWGVYYASTKTSKAPEPEATTTPITTADRKTYTDSSFGFSFTYPTTWTLGSQVIGNYGDTLVLKQPNGDSISVAKVSGSQVKDVDAKFGDVTYYFDTGRNSWMANWNTDSIDGPMVGLKTATSTYYTDSGLPVFNGLTRWGTAIVPLSHDKFLVITVTGGGDSSTLAPFVKSITKTN